MLPWLSSGVLRYAIVLTVGWLSFAAVVAATSGVVSRESTTVSPRPSSIIQLDQLDPCTQDPIALDVRLNVTPIARVDVDVLHTDILATLNGSMHAGPNRAERRVASVEHFVFTRSLVVGLLDQFEPRLVLVDRPNRLNTLLAVRLQPFWNGATETVSVVETALTCE